jgi:non-specific serine/threonine protein kinase
MEHATSMDALLVFDNCEHVIDLAAALIEQLLEAGPHIKVLATSREPLRLGGERLWAIPALAVPQQPDWLGVDRLMEFDSVRLFVERASLVTERQFDLHELRQIGTLTAGLDGLPLAIELAAARSEAVDWSDVGQLAERLGLAGASSRTAHRRQKTLASTINWSFELLDADLQAVLLAAAVFSGGFTRKAVSTVMADLAAQDRVPVRQVGHGLDTLVEKSMLTFDTHELPGADFRYRMLETIREFCLDRQAEAGLAGDLRAAHCAYFLHLSGEASAALVGEQQGRWFEALEADFANISAGIGFLLARPRGAEQALRMIVNLDRFWHNRGHLPYCGSVLDSALVQAAGDLDTELHCKALILAGQASSGRDLAVARSAFEEALFRCSAADRDDLRAQALAGLSSVSHLAGDQPAAKALGRESVELARKAGDTVVLGACLVCSAYGEREDLELSSTLYREAITVTARSGDRTWEAWAHNNYADTLLSFGGHKQARPHLQRAKDIFDSIGMPDPTPVLNLGWVCIEGDDLPQARNHFLSTIREARRIHRANLIALGMLGLACWAHRSGDPSRAALILGSADSLYDQTMEDWRDPERHYRDDLMTSLRDAIGAKYHSQYRAGRNTDPADIVASVEPGPQWATSP